MSTEAQVALIVGIIAAASGLVGALGGTGLGWYLTARSERRGEKRAAFVGLLSAIDACQHTAMTFHTAIVASDGDEFQQQRRLMNQALARVDTAVTVASLVVDDERPLRAGMAACIAEFEAAQAADHYKTVINPVYNDILALAKKELR